MDAETISAERELDALIAERVMGEKVVETDECNGIDNYWLLRATPDVWEWPALPSYSTDIAAAWQVVEFMARDFTPRVKGFPGGTAFLYWWERANLWADSAPEAATRICRAALAIMAGQTPTV